jgi:hypothetical protein
VQVSTPNGQLTTTATTEICDGPATIELQHRLPISVAEIFLRRVQPPRTTFLSFIKSVVYCWSGGIVLVIAQEANYNIGFFATLFASAPGWFLLSRQSRASRQMMAAVRQALTILAQPDATAGTIGDRFVASCSTKHVYFLSAHSRHADIAALGLPMAKVLSDPSATGVD